MAHTFTSGEASIFVQKDGPNTAVEYLGCHEVGDITVPEGDLTLYYCPDPNQVNKYIVKGSFQGVPGAITTSLTADFTDEIDAMERVIFPHTLFVNKAKRGRRNQFTNRDRGLVLGNARITQRTYTGVSDRSAENAAKTEAGYEISAEFVLRVATETVARQTISETLAINDIAFCNAIQQRTDDSVARRSCEIGFAVADAGSGASGNVLKTTNGSTWTATAADPFASAEHVISVGCFDVSRDTTRVVVARGVTDGAAPAEISYSDDSGATWTAVSVGATNGEFMTSRHGLFILDATHMWFASNLGYIYFSADSGLTWAAQESGTLTTTAWLAIRFATEDVGWVGGVNNEIARTVDGGSTWSAITGPSARSSDDITAIFALDKNRAWIGYDVGYLYYTVDGGTTWTSRSFSGSASGAVRDIQFFNELLGYMLHDTSAPVGKIHKTIDGGYSWELVTVPTNAGVNALYICDEWKYYVAGEAQGGTGFIAKGEA